MYCVLDDLIEAKDLRTISQLSNDESNPAEPDENVVNLNIQKACNVIDSFISGRYATPLQNVPGIIKDICIDLTVYNLYTRRNREISKESAVYLDHQAAMDILKRISEKKINLSGVPEVQGSPNVKNGVIRTNKKRSDRYFNSYTMRGYNGTDWN
jgi:phage gp36-like protein